jgi:hypothetical protein
MTINILKIGEVDYSKISYLSAVYNRESKNIEIPICYKHNKNIPFLVQVPSLFNNDRYNEKGELILPLLSKTEKITNQVSNFFKKLDDLFVSQIKSQITKLKTNKNIPQRNIKNISYRAIVNELDNDGEEDNPIYRNGLIRLKINDTITQLYDENKVLINLNEYENVLTQGSYVKSIIEINAIILSDNEVTINIIPHQLRVSEDVINKIQLIEYSFIESDSDESEDNKKECDDHPVKINEYMNDANTNMHTYKGCNDNDSNSDLDDDDDIADALIEESDTSLNNEKLANMFNL